MLSEKKGKFIVFEGIDGCGKSTQFYLFAEYLFSKNKYNHVFLTREPYKSREIRNILRKTNDPYKEAEILTKLFIKDRQEHIKDIILPALNHGFYVISDRYKLSTIVYQSTQGIQIQKLIDMHKNMPIPDITFIIDVDARIARQRMEKEKRNVEQKFEKSVEFQSLLRKAYLKIPKILSNEKTFVINGERPIKEISKEIIEIYEKEFD